MASGDGFNTTAVGQGFIVQLRYGTGAPPSNGAPAIGTAIGGAVNGVTAIVSSPQQIPFALQSMVSNLTPGTPCWFDLGLAAIGGGTASVENISLTELRCKVSSDFYTGSAYRMMRIADTIPLFI